MIATAMVDRGWDIDVYFGFDGPLVDRMKSDRCSTHVAEHRNWLRSAGLVRFARNLRAEYLVSSVFEQAFRRTCPDIVYVNTLVSYAAAVAAVRLKIPVIWHVRELFSDDRGELVWPASIVKPFIRRKITKLATTVVVNSCAVASNVFGVGNCVDVENVPNAAGPEFFGPRGDSTESRRKLGLPAGVPLIGLPGTLRRVKGHRFLFGAIPRILERVPDCQFAITGAIDSHFAQSLVAAAQEKPLAGRVVFTGAIGDMLSFYHACDACCVPSLSEPFGRTAIECFATRTPVVASAVGGLTEIVHDDENGLSVPSGDESALADALVSLLNDQPRRCRLVKQAAADADDRYTYTAYTERVASIVNNVLN